ncbi:NAD(P)-dependent alcohol dehydrogenase [Shimwellia blattae]|uniref:NADP-alcohol dehydrogenase n=1 Tax=Shimwellia blattae (strain ATCC 29907 / DSM 4481 / JCM 1650 / NBRC 105725 / CDC 9005-74) TaxID=630626 RepID=I2B914_SHIBC|nr:NAD(P)-dependent alcohol dehydrogenase [Shimwellia blattae]AFJ47018.1 NADP-alcohol dehydrogenase [Shimwellia blattae DSM 4481 = NBRC 105725]GAB80859.1 putative oxidoreductase YahK [Shimwellia blattae DSM 4481 = NBRC 105725]VDY64512.1 NADP-dependent alcohol dehydrogenase C [Shimwellia blattae]VEC22620.1 NADP-dependent alcohol dehydrogenase C [Shimwellia blattae]
MTVKVSGYGVLSPTAPVAPLQFSRRTPRADDVVIDILYCGVCHSDLHQARNDWGGSQYPLVPGHEITGVVSAVGPEVTRFKPGDNVGVGCMVDACRTCDPCRQGLEQYCQQGPVLTYNGMDRHDHMPTYGGYSRSITCSENFVLRIPRGLPLDGAAPLLCAGITTWSPLRHWRVNHNSKVAVVGLGGLGHMALKLAHALGAEVTLFTRSPGKEADALRLGAHHVVLSTDAAQMAAVGGQFDVIIDTVPCEHDINPYLPTLTLDGTLVFVGLLGDMTPPVSTVPMILGRRAVAGSCIGGIAETQEMLDFCAEHGVVSDIEVIDIATINDAWQRMQKSDVKYRFVIDMKTLI